ncbi:MAG TPA: sulfatase [Candidatus Latescibacteria bacterium]|mgnify:CR=1 FL=1|nr:sulfatase [Gemmatimonadota bacterium]HCR19673.1 sulfatase [Candidatus Latescibacterota bacterium]
MLKTQGLFFGYGMNFLLIGIDSLRADRLGCYGYPRATSPFLDRMAEEGVCFDNFYAPGIPTQPSFTTLFTGQLPTTHGIVAHRGRWTLDVQAPFLPELLSRAGYSTVAVDNLADHHQGWFSRGFEQYINPREKGTFPSCHAFNAVAMEWLTQNRTKPFFMFVHYWDPHTPYMPDLKYRSLFYEGDPTTENEGSLAPFYKRPLMDWWSTRWLDVMATEWPEARGKQITDIEFVKAQYDSEVRCADEGVQQLMGYLDNAGLLDDTMVMVFGDHGEELGEHGIYFDHHGLYEGDIKVPLIVHLPITSAQGKRVIDLVQHSDLSPTVLDAAGLPRPESMDGRSILSLLEGGSREIQDQVLLTEECTWMAKWALKTERWKYIAARAPDFYGKPERELYDLHSDPGEQVNLWEEHREKAAELEIQLEELLWRRLEAAGRSEDPVLTHGITLGKKMFD